MKTKNFIVILGMLLAFLAIVPLIQAQTLGANLFYEDLNNNIRTIDQGESFYIEAYGDAFEEKITSAKLNIINDNTNEKIELFSDSSYDVFYSKTHFLIDESKYPGAGDFTLEFVIYGEFGSQASDELYLTIKGEDTEAPEVNIISPSEGDTLNSNDVTVEFTAIDNEGIDTCEYSLNSGNRQTIGCNNPFDINAQEGQNTITIYATDDNGNEGSDSVTFTVNTLPDIDTTAPSITIDSPIDGEEYDTNQIDITVSTDESAELEYKINGTQGISRRSLTAGFVSSYDNSIVLDKGNYTLTIYATDSKGNENNKSVNFKINPSLSEDEDEEDEETYEHKIYKKQYEPKTTEVDVSEDDRELNWFQKFINWLWELFGAKAPY